MRLQTIKTLSCCALFVLFCAASVHPQSTQNTEVGFSISGKVTYRGKGIGGCAVYIWKQPYQEPSNAGTELSRTDSNGHYQIRNVLPGNYYISLNAPGFYLERAGRPVQQLQPLAVTTLSLSDVNFKVERGGVISGKVTTGDNQPVIEIPVSLLPENAKPNNSQFQIDPRPIRFLTDDRGFYRIYGIPPGRYRVAAADAITSYASNRGATAYRRSFYPDTLDEAKARVFEVQPGSEFTNIDIKAGPIEESYSINGQVVDEQTGRPVANISCGIDIVVNGKLKGGISGLNFSNAKGEFLIDRLTPGTYRISVPSYNLMTPAANQDYFGQSADFEIKDKNVEGIVVKASRTAAISGTIQVEGTNDKSLISKLSGLRLSVLTIPATGQRVSGKSVPITSEEPFSVNGLIPGKLMISPSPSQVGESMPFILSRIVVSGVVQNQPIELKAGDQISDLLLVFTASSSLRGTVKLASGEIPPRSTGMVNLFRDQTFVQRRQIDSRGQFLFESLPAGTYRLMVSLKVPGGTQPSSTEQVVSLTNAQVAETVVILPDQ